jgi:hypothetical protein
VIDVELPPGPAVGALVRGFAACLASVTEVPVTDLPLPADDLTHALGAWRSWLAEHGSGLVPIADPDRFQWAGWWIAVVADPAGPTAGPAEVAVLAFGTPPGVVLSPQAPAMLGRATMDLRIREAYAVASLDPVLHQQPAGPDLRGTVAGLAVAPAAEASMQLLEATQARAGRGLDGDRYAARGGTFSPRADRRPGYDLTLIATEVLDEMAAAGQALDFVGTGATCSPAALTSTLWSGAPSASATCSAKGAGCASPAPTWSGSAAPGSCDRSSTEAGCASTSSPMGRSAWARRSSLHDPATSIPAGGVEVVRPTARLGHSSPCRAVAETDRCVPGAGRLLPRPGLCRVRNGGGAAPHSAPCMGRTAT